MQPWQLQCEQPGKGAFIRTVTRRYKLPTGRLSDWDICLGSVTVAVLALTTELKVVLVRQFRPGPGKVLQELPGGRIERGESPLAAAARELREETGYRPGTLKMVGSCWVSGVSTARRFAVLAQECRPIGHPCPDADEVCEPTQLSIQEFQAHLRSGELTDVSVAYMALEYAGLLRWTT